MRLLIVVVILFLFTIPIHGAELSSLAVNDLDARGITKDEASVLTDKLRSELTLCGLYRILERGKMEEILKEQGFQQSGACSESECFVQMGQLLGVENLVVGSVGKVGEAFSVNVRMLSVQTGEIKRDISMTHKGQVEDLLETTIPVVVKKLTGTYKEKGKSHFWWWVAGGVAILGGGAAVYVLTQEEPAKETPDPNLTVRW